MTNCCVCRRDREAHKTLTLTDEEKIIVARSTGRRAPDTLSYCKACWKISTDRVQGPQLMKGMAQLHMRTRGVKSAEQIASELQDRMLARAAKKKAES